MKNAGLPFFVLLACAASQPVIANAQIAQQFMDGGMPPVADMAPRGEQAIRLRPPAPAGVTLKDALAAAYAHNPDLAAARASLRGVDEEYAQAWSGFRPSLTGSAAYDSTHVAGSENTHTSSDPKTLALTARQPVYSGGATLAAVDRADETVRAARAALQIAEQSVLRDATGAFVSVLRDMEIANLNRKNESVLQSHLDAAGARFRLGEITRTDVSQAESRLAAATAARLSAEGTLKVSRAGFERIVGFAPDGLVRPDGVAAVPGTLEEALAQALRSNPLLAQARHQDGAATAARREAEAALRPAVDLSGSVARIYDPSGAADDYVDQTTVGVLATMPLYSAGGATYSRVRQARQLETQRRREADGAERSVRQDVISAWETLQVAQARLSAQRAQIEAAQMAQEGVKVEAQYGSRTTLDLLDAEQEYLNAQVAHVVSDTERMIATYGLLAAMGHLTAEHLALGVSVYNPEENFQKVKKKWAGTKIMSEK